MSGSLSEDCSTPVVILPLPLPDPVPVPVPLTLPVPVPIPMPVLPVDVCLLAARPRPCALGWHLSGPAGRSKYCWWKS